MSQDNYKELARIDMLNRKIHDYEGTGHSCVKFINSIVFHLKSYKK